MRRYWTGYSPILGRQISVEVVRYSFRKVDPDSMWTHLAVSHPNIRHNTVAGLISARSEYIILLGINLLLIESRRRAIEMTVGPGGWTSAVEYESSILQSGYEVTSFFS
jgi:hypothetical protein